MIWNTQSINKLSEEIDKGGSLKSILRLISIDSLLSPENDNPIFPFYLSISGDDPLNNKLKAANIPFEKSTEEESNYQLYKENPTELYKSIRDGKILPHERIYIDSYVSNRNSIITSPMGSGSSMMLAFCIVHYLTFNPNKSILLIDRGRSSIALQHYLSFPFYLKPGIVSRDIHRRTRCYEIVFDNGTKLSFSTEKDIPMTENFDFVVIDGFYKKFDMIKFCDSLNPECKVIIKYEPLDETLDISNCFSTFDKICISDYLPILTGGRFIL